MCGIAGIIAGAGRSIDPAELARLSAAIAHRGPDDEGAAGWSASGGTAHAANCAGLPSGAQVGLAHRRLSIIDTGPGGHQPMASADDRYVLITNGEIYNYLELRRELEAEGDAFRTQSDTEVMLAALARWGAAKALPRFTGMFAFALLDTRERRVTLGRDPFGIKPLLWAMRGGDLAFASEPGALLQLSGLSRATDAQAVYDYLRFGLTDRGSTTLFRDIRHLPPAHFAVIDLDRPAAPAPAAYWRASTMERTGIGFAEAASELGRLFRDSVALHLRADVPVGAALSGGIDSTAVAAAMREAAGSRLALHTFSFVAPGSRHDESRWAELSAAAVGATAHRTEATGADLARDIDDLIRVQGEPFGSTSIYAQNRVYRLVRNTGIKVTLDGQGADELLGGYLPFLAARLASLLRRGEIARAARFLCATRDMAGPAGLLARAARFILPEGLQGLARRAVGEDLVPGWMDGTWLARNGVTAAAPQRPRSGRVLMDELAESLESRVLPALLRYQDRNSMAYAVESRVPFLTTTLADFIYSLPESFLVSDRGETKSVFRAAMRGLVPDAILGRRDKIGFITPQDTWLREAGGWLSGLIGGVAAQAVPAIKQDAFRSQVEALAAGDGLMPQHVWRAANLILWAEIHEAAFDA